MIDGEILMQIQAGLSVYFSGEVGCPMLRDKGDVGGLGFDICYGGTL